MNRGRLFILRLLVLSLILMCWGCRNYYRYDTRDMGYKEVYKESCKCYILRPDSTTNGICTYTADKMLVCNVNLHSLDIDIDSNISKRLFTSENILEIRQCPEISNHYIEFIKARGVELKTGRFLFARKEMFRLPDESEVGTYYILVPFKRKRLFKEYSYAYEIPVTYINDTLIYVHNRPMDKKKVQEIKNHLLHIMDTASASYWIERCQQAIKVEGYSDCFKRYYLRPLTQ